MQFEPAPLLIRTKLLVPAATQRAVTRLRLIERLGAAPCAGLTLVCAPAGYGKTTLLVDFAHHLLRGGAAVAWYALDPSDDAPLPFAAYLTASLMEALGPLPVLAQLARSLRAAPEVDLHAVTAALIHFTAALERRCFLVLDDYHLIETPAIHSAVAALIARLPDTVSVVIGSRSDPPLPLARLRARGNLLEIRAADLRFTPAETEQFLNERMRLDLSAAGVAALEAGTEGWITGLQLAALSLADRADREQRTAAFRGSHRYLADYLMEEVVARQPEAVQNFLLSTSILNRLCVPLCDAITGAPSAALLDHIEGANLFLVPLDDERSWFRYHHLFGDFLRSRLDRLRPDSVPDLHRAAAAWLAANGFLREAARHSFQTGSWDDAAAFVEDHSFTMITRGDIATITEWCSAFPEDLIRRRPMLSILQCWAWVLAYRRQNRPRVEARLRDVETAAALLDPEPASFLREHTAVVRAFLMMAPDCTADPRAQLAQARRLLDACTPFDTSARFGGLLAVGYAQMALQEPSAARDALDQARQAAISAGLPYGIVEATFHLALLAHCQGLSAHALDLCAQTQALVTQTTADADQPVTGCLEVAAGCILLDGDRPEDAEPYLLRGLERTARRMNPSYLLEGSVALYHLRLRQGRADEAEQALRQVEDGWLDIAFCTRGLRAAHAFQAHPHDPAARARALDWLASFESEVELDSFLPGFGPFGAAGAFYLAALCWARIHITAGSAAAVLPYLERQLAAARRGGLTRRASELATLIAQADPSGARPTPQPGIPAPLSEREIEILRLVACGATNNDIAAQLYITVGTVKSHLNHILTKLDANNRTEAVAKARANNLLTP